MVHASVSGVGLTRFGVLPGRSALQWQAAAARAALADAAVRPGDVDAVLCGYATTLGHLMPADLLAEHLGISPAIAVGASAGGATGLSMLASAVRLVRAGDARTVLVAAGEDRASGRSRDDATRALAQVGHAEQEVPLGGTVPAYYALLASSYLHRHGLGPEALAPLAVTMRRHAAAHPGAQFRDPVTVDDVLGSRLVAEPLRLLDCCPISDGGAALVITADEGPRSVRVTGVGEAHRHQHLTEADESAFGARDAAWRALAQAGRDLGDVDLLGVYDSFTITLALLLEEIGISAPGRAGADAAAGRFDRTGPLPLNTHGGLLSYGHCGVAGGMAHVVEAVTRLREGDAGTALVHGDGGVMSAHVSAVLEAP